jgi:hypothetical protein
MILGVISSNCPDVCGDLTIFQLKNYIDSLPNKNIVGSTPEEQ